MKNLKLALTSILTLASGLVANATISTSGTALLKVPNIAVGDVSYLIIDETNTGFANLGSVNPNTNSFVAGTIYSGTSIAINGDSFGSDFTIVGTKTTALSFGSISVGASYTISVANGVDAGDNFAIIVFENSTSTAILADTYRIYTDTTWVVPPDSTNWSFGPTAGAGVFKQLGTTATPAILKTVASTTVVPEPSTYAALAGVAVLGLAALRRRRA